MIWLGLPLGLQALCMLIDELHCHRARGLPRWERIGHPIDTSSVLACYGITLFAEPRPGALGAYLGLACLSCLLVTKDELVHARLCSPFEHWLHSVLFLLHPLVLGSVALLWVSQERTLLWLSAAPVAAFGCYQTLYWNVSWKKRTPSRSTTPSTMRSESAGTPLMTTPSRSCARNPASETLG